MMMRPEVEKFSVCEKVYCPSTLDATLYCKSHPASDQKTTETIANVQRKTATQAIFMRSRLTTDPKLSDGGGWRGPCMAGGKAAAEARAVTAVVVRCSA